MAAPVIVKAQIQIFSENNIGTLSVMATCGWPVYTDCYNFSPSLVVHYGVLFDKTFLPNSNRVKRELTFYLQHIITTFNNGTF